MRVHMFIELVQPCLPGSFRPPRLPKLGGMYEGRMRVHMFLFIECLCSYRLRLISLSQMSPSSFQYKLSENEEYSS